MMDQNVVTRLQNYFKTIPEVTAVVVYGSFSAGKETINSDIDLGVCTTTALTADLKIKIISDLALIFRRPIDVVDLQNIHVPLLQEVLTKGSWILLDSNSTKEKLVHRMIYEVADFLPLREKIQTEKIKRFINK
jgi:uncharacterized protein